MKTKYGIYDNDSGIIFIFFDTLDEARDYIKNLILPLPKDEANKLKHKLSILKVEEVYESTIIDGSQDTDLLGYTPSTISDGPHSVYNF